jgi:anti-sigma28 factor (negative regulator of flagellin synthesis)
MVKLTKKQVKRLKDHAKNHSNEHIEKMKEEIRKGKSFTAAHQIALKFYR